jgi:uncharacterized protein with ParB-like and HNH nuclease domain
MANILDPHLKSMEELFSGNKTYFVPIYQRSFDWGKDEREELWEDITSAIAKTNEEYFLGTIVLKNKDMESFEIIDGQQRLICISMIFGAIYNVLKSHNDDGAEEVYRDFLDQKSYSKKAKASSKSNPKLNLNRTNDPIYQEYVFQGVSLETVSQALKNKKTLHPSNIKLLEAYSYFLTQVTNEASRKGQEYDDFVTPLVDCLRQRIKVIAIPVVNEEGAYLVFEAVNARGKELAVSDLVKNRLYYEAGNEKVRHAQNLWDHMESDLHGSSIPEYLRHFWIARKIQGDYTSVREKRLYRTIVKSLPSDNRHDVAIALLSELSKSAIDYAKLSDYSLWPDDPAYGKAFEDTLRDLDRFGVSQCYPALLNAVHFFKKTREVAKLFEAIANFSFRYNIIGKGTSGDLESIFGDIASQNCQFRSDI